MDDAAGVANVYVADAGGNDALTPPSNLPQDEHGVWRRFHELGALGQFRLPDEELNPRLSREGRRTARKHRRRDNRVCQERLEAAAQSMLQPTAAMPALPPVPQSATTPTMSPTAALPTAAVPTAVLIPAAPITTVASASAPTAIGITPPAPSVLEQPRVEQPSVEQPRVEQPSVLEQPIVEQPHTTAFSPQRAAQKRHLEEQLEITDIEIEQHEHRRAQLRQQLQVFEYEHALAQPDAQHWPTIRRSDITPTRVEQRVPNFQYCAYHRCFHHVTSFSTTQQFARPDKRYCDTFLAENLRASTVPSVVILESELYRMAKLMKVKVNAD